MSNEESILISSTEYHYALSTYLVIEEGRISESLISPGEIP